MDSICHICGREYEGPRCLACTQQSIDLMDFGTETLGSSVATGVSGTFAVDDSMAKLKLTNSDQVFAVVKPVCRIGMDPSNDIVLSSTDGQVAKFHSQLVLEDKHYTLRDLGTKEGTLLNGERVVIDATIYDGDQIKIGTYTFYFVSDLPDEE